MIATAIAPIQEQITQLNQSVESQIDSYVSEGLAAQHEQTTQYIAGYIAAQQKELQQRVDVYISVEVAKAYEAISQLVRSVGARLELHIRDATHQVAVTPEAPTQKAVTSSAIQQGKQELSTITLDNRLTQSGLAQRFKHINSKTGRLDNSRVSKKQSKPDFEQWSQKQDPDRIGWSYDEHSKLFSPVIQ